MNFSFRVPELLDSLADYFGIIIHHLTCLVSLVESHMRPLSSMHSANDYILILN